MKKLYLLKWIIYLQFVHLYLEVYTIYLSDLHTILICWPQIF